MKVRAKAKVAAERRQAQKDLESNPGPLEVRISESKQVKRVKTIDTDELKNVLADTVQRVYRDEFGQDIDMMNARDHFGFLIALIMKYGHFDESGHLKQSGGITMRDHEYKRIPRCKSCKG